MALINCNECNQQISDRAESCPKCGAPSIAQILPVKSATTTTQLTGKNLKLQQLIYTLIFLVGFILIFTELKAMGIFLILGGIIGNIYTRAMGWWHHG